MLTFWERLQLRLWLWLGCPLWCRPVNHEMRRILNKWLWSQVEWSPRPQVVSENERRCNQ